jgi:hypothetical protein
MAVTPTLISGGTKPTVSNKNGGNIPIGKSLLKRRPIPFRDALVVRSSAKKTIVTVDGHNYTIVEFKPRISPRGRKKGSVNAKASNNTPPPNIVLKNASES